MKETEKVNALFIYPETVSGEGPNEVISLLVCLVNKIMQGGGPDYQHLILYADNSPSQSKENYLFFYCCYTIKIGCFKESAFSKYPRRLKFERRRPRCAGRPEQARSVGGMLPVKIIKSIPLNAISCNLSGQTSVLRSKNRYVSC